MTQDKFKRLRSKVMFTIVGGAVIINPLYAGNAPKPAQPAAQTQAASQSNNQNASSNSQDTTQLQTIVVTGIRHSMAQSMNIKRDAIGFVDAISAEDIGKFPDSNLAVSLQRVPGVSISRRNGTGSLVTVRGFGPQFNLVTFNGRHMPSADGFGNGQTSIGGIGSGTRSFNFAQLSPIGVRALVVHKTGRADADGGGIGATVDIETWRPLERKAGKVVAALSAKGIYDKGEPFNSSVTPGFSGIFSYASPDKTWGVSLVASHKKRHTGNGQFTENLWKIKKWTGSDPGIRADANVVNPPHMGQLYAIPNDTRYAFQDMKTERTNAHAVVQFRPIDSLTLTLDYLYSKQKLDAIRVENSQWLQDANSFTDIEFDTGKYPVATPIMIRDVPPGPKDFDDEQQYMAQKFELNSIGFNAKWNATENLSFALDAHDSKNKSVPNGPVGGSMNDYSMAGTNNCYGSGGVGTGTGPMCGGAWAQTFNFNGTFPQSSRAWYASHADALNNVGGLVNQPWRTANVGVANSRVWAQSQESEIKELQLDGTLFFEDGRLQFGVNWQDSTMHHINHVAQQQLLGGWSIENAGQYPDLADYYHQVDTGEALSDFDTANTVAPLGIAANGGANGLTPWVKKHYGYTPHVNPAFAGNQHLEEKTKSAYFQFTHNDTLAGFPTTTRIGVRYATTQVTSTSLIQIPSAIDWQSNNDFKLLYASGDKKPFSVKASYDNILPNFDFSILFPHNVKARVAVSKTMARANYGNLYAGPSPGTPSGSTLVDTASRASGSRNNPALKPLVSDNLDLGLSWYFAPTSYVSVTFWDKRVKNFVGTQITQAPLLGITDPTTGPDAKAAQAFLASPQCAAQVSAAGNNPATQCALDNTHLFTAVALLQNAAKTGGLAAYDGSGAQVTAMEDYDVLSGPGDPLYQFNVSQPVNEHEAQLHGWEFGGQYFLGQTGFGIMANYTIVKSDTHNDNNADPGTTQFALTGLSNTANGALMYQKYGWSVRLAYNWRGRYLLATNQGGVGNPYYVNAYHEYDLSVAYQFNDHFSAKFTGINLTSENLRWEARTPHQPVRIVDQAPRYTLGVSYKF